MMADVFRLIVPLTVVVGGASIATYALLDGAATGCAISTKLAQKLRMPIKYETVPVIAFGRKEMSPQGLTSFSVEPLDRSFTIDLDRVLVNDILTTENERPPNQTDIEKYPFIQPFHA